MAWKLETKIHYCKYQPDEIAWCSHFLYNDEGKMVDGIWLEDDEISIDPLSPSFSEGFEFFPELPEFIRRCREADELEYETIIDKGTED